MAMHVRRRIREAVEAALGALPSGAHVVKPAAHPVAPGRLPAVRVMTLAETSAPETMGDGGTLSRTLTLAVQALADGGDDLEDVLDALAAQIEEAVGADPTFGGLADDAWLSGTEKTVGEPGERRTGTVELAYAVLYRTPRGAPTAAV